MGASLGGATDSGMGGLGGGSSQSTATATSTVNTSNVTNQTRGDIMAGITFASNKTNWGLIAAAGAVACLVLFLALRKGR
jgi:hypothetical protein